ncbi:Ammonium transporter [Balamuthia mandrillaris]
MATVEERIAALEEGLAQYQTDLDTVWVLLTATLVFRKPYCFLFLPKVPNSFCFLLKVMQAGFALVEAGSVQQKNITNILLKNVVDVSIGSVVFYLIGFGFAFGDDGDNGFIGDRYFALSDLNDEDSSQSWSYFFFQLTFAATSATIVSGSVAERCRMSSYLVYTTAISGFIYPVVAHWVWSSTGWLSAFRRDGDYFISDVGFIDFAGSGVVHMVGGACGLMGALIIGPRLGRFQKGKLFSGKIHGHNIAYSALGTFILWTGWYGFNPGSTLLATGVSHIAARCAVTTTISAGTASMCTLALGVCWSLWVEKEFVIDISLSLNGVLAGLVGITSSCAVVQPWAALIIGVVSAFVYFFSAKLLELLKIDDPVDAAPIHFFCGIWGVLAVGFFAWEGFVEETYRPTNDYGVFVGVSL